jgi:uncharacterized protein (TIGR02099 family)
MAMPRWRRALRALAWTAVGLYFGLGLLVLILRHAVLPAIADHRAEIEINLAQALGQPVAIRAIEARWRRLWPSLRIHGLEIRDAQGRPALGFDEVEADIAWSSLWRLAPHFARLEIKAPRLDLRRDADGRLFAAGLEIKTEATSGAGFSDWLLTQDRIVIRDAVVTWHDELRRAPPLALTNLNLDLRNRRGRHQFGLTAEPPRELAARLDIRGDFRGNDIQSLAAGNGRAYAELDYADLAGWHAWVDYPFELTRGYGGLRLWLDFDQTLAGVTADLRLSRTVARLAPELPVLDMEYLDGKLAARRDNDGFLFQARHLALATRGGIRIEPTDIDFHWQPGAGDRSAHGETSANVVDLGAMAELAAYVPFDAAVRAKIVALGPQGRVRDLQAAWTGEFDAPATYRLDTRFENLGLNAQGTVPGFFGLDGTIEANERGGAVSLATRAATLELPAVFEQSAIVLATLDATADWTVRDGALDVRLQSARFENADAAGEASGRYRYAPGQGPGEVDLAAKLTRADGGSVWRYMPLVVGAEVRHWLRDSISGGVASATLRLKGDLKRFPFRDGSGVFEVKGPFQGATLRYVEGWPAFENVTGDLLFAGARMAIRAQRATLWGVRLHDVTAEIGDLDRPDQPLVITGGAQGPTADFLRYIDASPVGGYIDNVTQGMKAGGAGELRLRLDLPLRNLDATKVSGNYRLLANQLTYMDGLPPISDINGELRFTEKGVEGKKIRAAMLGAPLTVDMVTEEGRVSLQASGGVSVAALRQQYGHPALEHLAGSTPWKGFIRVKKRSAELRVESSLVGISSSLPAPFNKTATDTMPLVFERKAVPEAVAKGRRAVNDKASGERDQLEVSLGDTLRAQIVRRHVDDGFAVERGLIAVDVPDARLPERGVLLAVKAPRVDVDFWRRMVGGNGGTGAGAGNGATGGGLAPTQVDLRTDELRGFGRAIHALQLSGRQEGDAWKFDVKANEASGRMEWTSRGDEGRLSARLARLDIPEGSGVSSGQAAGEGTERLPAIDVVVDQLSWHGRALGRLQVQAGNAAGIWGAGFQIKNEDGEIEGTSSWQEPRTGVASASAMDFRLTARNVENMLGRLGYPEAVKRGRATLVGQLYWNGPPTKIDYPSLGGNLRVEAARGQFKKLEPGVGRLLGVLSLQSLPRRISLDFRDIFSEGFAFENIDGKVVISRGVMETSEFEIAGPAAKVLMNGTVNLVSETQNLKVRVQPAIGESIATGVLLVSPVIGASAWLMNRMFGNPLDKAFAFDYTVTGSWADPKVEKVAAQGPSSAMQTEGNGMP